MSKYMVTLVDAHDRALGMWDKVDAHREGLLHRAFSVFIFDRGGRLLLQQRSAAKYHSPGLWSNTCCGHPGMDEDVEFAAWQRLHEEMGFRALVKPLFRFLYRAELAPAMVEHELDHVFVGAFEGSPAPDPAEVADWKWMEFGALREAAARQPQTFTAWLRILLGDAGHVEALAQASRSVWSQRQAR